MLVLRSLRHRPFAWLWSGQTISRLGDSLYRIALAWWVLEKTGSPAAMGTVLVFSSAPMVLFVLIGGVAVDRLPRPRVMLLSDVLRGAVVAVVAVLAAGGALQIWHLYAASIVFGLVAAFFQPAYTAVVPEITPAELLTSANSLTSLSAQVSGILGPGLGAAIVALGGTPLAFALDAVSFIISAATLLPLQYVGAETVPAAGGPGPRRGSGLLREAREGIAEIVRNPWLWITISLAAFGNVTQSGVISVGLPFLVKDRLKVGVEALGLIYSAISVGSVVGALALGNLPRIPRRGLLAYGGWGLGGLLVVAMGLFHSVPGVVVPAALLGACGSAFNLVWTNTLQELVPRDRLGRVSSIDYLGSFLLLPVGYAVAGAVTTALGPSITFALGGALTALLAGLGLLHPAIRRLN